MSEELVRLLTGAAAAVVVAALALRRRSLSHSGALAAIPVGALVVAGGGWWTGLLLVLFFASSSALSRLRPARTDPSLVVRGATRDAVQVLANGGAAASAAAIAALAPEGARSALVAACAGAIAAATADTWATEIGALSPSPPRLVVGGAVVPPGTSGAVTPVGTAAAAVGAVLIALVHALGVAAGVAPGAPWSAFAGTALAGVAGGLADSVLGATLQAAYRCPACDQPTEHRRHRCGTPTRLVRGHPAVTNDVVNAVATALGALVGVASAVLLP